MPAIEHDEESAFCGREGHIMSRPAPEDVDSNGKRFHIHTFGCQVGCGWAAGRAVCGACWVVA